VRGEPAGPEEAVARRALRGRALPAAILFAVALAVRLVYLHQIAGSPLGRHLLGDGRAYDEWARRIAGGQWWGGEVFYQAPLYPYLLALVYRLFGAAAATARVVQAVAGAAGCVLVARAGERFFDRRTGWVAGWWMALYAPAVFFDGEIQKASLSLPFSAAILLLLAALAERRRPAVALGAGALIGAFALSRENALLLAPLLAGWLALRPGETRARRAAAAAALLCGVFLVLLPVALRNYAVGGEPLPTTSQAGTNFYIGNHEGADGRYQPLVAGHGSARYEREDATALAEAASGRKLAPAEVSAYWGRRALDFVRGHPGAWLRLLARKTFLVWNRREIVDTTSLEAAADSSPLLAALATVFHFGVLAPLAAAGVWWTRGRWRDLDVLYLWLAGWAFAVAAFYVFARYRYPLVPVLALFAAAALTRAWDRLRRRAVPAGSGWVAPAALAAVVAVIVNWPPDARDPRAVTYASLGRAMEDDGDSAGGARMLEHALELSPTFVEAAKALGDLRFRAGDLAGAERAWRRTVELEPGAAGAWNDLGVLAARSGRKDEALDLFRRAVAADGKHASARFNLARALLDARDFAGAREQFRALVGLEPDDVEAHVQLANLLAYGGDAAAAAAEYRRALELDSGRADAHFKLWAVEESRGESGPENLAHLRRAIELAPAYAEKLGELAAQREREGRAADAARLYRDLLELAPDDGLKSAARTALRRLRAPVD
jgi:tetratricopeptide (TPR) repeat protein